MTEFFRFLGQLVRLDPRFLGGAAAVQAVQEQKFRRLIKHAAEKSPFYARKFAGIDLASCALTDLPILSKREMMENFDDVVTDRSLRRGEIQQFLDEPSNLGRFYHGKYGIAHTSGSQGRPALIVQDKASLGLTFAMQVVRGSSGNKKRLRHLAHIFSPARMAVVTQRPGFYPSGFSFSYIPAALKPFFKVKWLSVFDPIATTVKALNEFQPNFITGYTSSLQTLAREQSAGRLRLRGSGALEQIINISEPLPGVSLAKIEDAFGVPVADQYAMGECLALTSGCPGHSGSHLNADYAILEVVDADYRPVAAGQKGAKVLVTNLYNLVQPFIRYEIDDVVTMSATPCSCGSCLPLIRSIEGRSKDKLWVEIAGKYRELPYYLFLAALHNDLDLAEHQVVQTGRNRFTVRVVPQAGKVLSKARIRRLVQKSVDIEGMSDIVRFDVELADHIDRGPSGKAERVRNLVGPPPTDGVAVPSAFADGTDAVLHQSWGS